MPCTHSAASRWRTKWRVRKWFSTPSSTGRCRFDDLREISRNIQCPALIPAILEPLCQPLAAVMPKDIDVQFALSCQALHGQVAAADETRNRVIGVVPEQQIELRVQGMRKEQFDYDLTGTKLRCKTAQRQFVLAGGNAQRDLLT